MTTQTLNMKRQVRETVDARRIWLAGLVGIVASVAANLVLRALFFAVMPLPVDFPPLQAGAVATVTTIGTLAAAIVYALIVRFSARPVTVFRWVAVVALILSILPNLALVADPTAIPFPFAGASSMAFGVLIAFHIVAALVSVAVLTGMTRKK